MLVAFSSAPLTSPLSTCVTNLLASSNFIKVSPYFSSFNSSPASFKITVGSLINFDLAENIFIYDKLSGIYHDIKNGYYDVTIDSESKDRFEITFKNPSLTTADSEVLKSFTVFQNNESNELVISNTQLIDMKSCYVYDIHGKVIFSKEKLGSNNQYLFPTSSLSDGVYIVKLKTSNNLEVSKKVIVKKK